MARAFGMKTGRTRTHADVGAETHEDDYQFTGPGEYGGVTYGDSVHIGPDGSTDPMSATEDDENAAPVTQAQRES